MEPPSTQRVLYLLLSILLVALTAFFVAAEFALVKVRATRIQELCARNVFGARKVAQALLQLNDYLSAAQLGITICALVLGNVGHHAVGHLLGPLIGGLPSWVASLLTLALITLIEVVIGEMAPKSVAIQNAEKIALAVIYPLDWFYKVFKWPIRGMVQLASLVLRPFGLKIQDGLGDDAHSEAEIRSIVAQSAAGGAIDEDEVQLVQRVFDFSDRTAREVMIPRPDVTFLHADKTLGENLEIAEKSGHSRFPVIEDGSADRVLGLVHAKELLKATIGQENPEVILRDAVAIRELMSIPETKLVDDLLREFQQKRQRLAVILDEYGGTAGIVTLEDIVEEIVGDIQDEFDRSAPEMEPAGKDCWTVDGKMSLDKLARALSLTPPEEEPDVDSVGGWVMASLPHAPHLGASAAFGEAILTVTELAGRRIRRVRVCLPERGQSLLEGHAAASHHP